MSDSWISCCTELPKPGVIVEVREENRRFTAHLGQKPGGAFPLRWTWEDGALSGLCIHEQQWRPLPEPVMPVEGVVLPERPWDAFSTRRENVWVYALFDENGNEVTDMTVEQARTNAACYSKAPEWGRLLRKNLDPRREWTVEEVVNSLKGTPYAVTQ